MKTEHTVTYRPGHKREVPMIRISNHSLIEANFRIGDRFGVKYGNGIIVLTRINEEICVAKNSSASGLEA